MNHIYRIIWSKASNNFVAVPENTASCGKASSSSKSVGKAHAGQKAISCAITAALLAMTSNSAFAVWVSGVNNFDGATIGVAGVVDGNGAGGFLVGNGITAISNATLTNFQTTGGQGSGGGAGFGGAIFVNSGASVTLNNVNFISNTAQGGDGGFGVKGGTLNNLFNAGSVGASGTNGSTPIANLWLDPNGPTGTKGSNGSPNISGFGGAGGNGSAGGDAGNTSPALMTAVATSTLDLALAVAEAGVAGSNPFTVNVGIGLIAGSVLSAGAALVTSIADLAAFEKSLYNGFIGLGGNGGTGGNGGNGGAFYGGGAGGAGGTGGAGAGSIILGGGATGGDAGSGGSGGMGGFGAGGGAGGDGAVGGAGAGGTPGTGSPAVAEVTKTITPADTYQPGYTDAAGAFINIGAAQPTAVTPYNHATILVNGVPAVVTSKVVPGVPQIIVTQPAVAAVLPGAGGSAKPNGLDGAGGAGGGSDFGGGGGASGATPGGSVAGGSGGSAMGGAIFVRNGGILTITGNAKFDNNQLLEGAGQASVAGTITAGSTGSTAGADLFMMKGSSVTLNPGLGNIITFNGDIADDSSASGVSSGIPAGQGAGLTVASGRVVFNGTNTYTGQTRISGGVLQSDDTASGSLTGIHSSSNINLAGGVLQSNGGMHLVYAGNPDTFNRYVGAAPTRVQWTGSGGFAASDSATAGPLTVELNNGSGSLTWGQGGFIANGNALIFGSDTAADSVIFTNTMNLNTGSGTILVVANGVSLATDAANIAAAQAAGTAISSVPILGDISDTATVTGVISNGSLIVGDLLHTGTLFLSGVNTYAGGTTINGGTLALSNQFNAKGAVISQGALNANGAMTINAGVLDLSNPGAKAIGTLSGAGSILLGANMLTVNQATASTFSGVLQDGGMFKSSTGAGLTGAALTKAGLGNLTMSGANTYTGATQIDVGTLTLAGKGSLASKVVGVAAGATLADTNAGLVTTAVLTNNGTVSLGANQQISQLLGAGIVDLTGGTLTVDSGNFTGVLLSNNATFGLSKVSTGVLALSGANTYTGLTQINAGSVNLTGSLASNTVNVALGSTLDNISGGLAATAALTNDGTVNMGANNTIATLTNTGTINGVPNTLTAATYALNSGSVINANLGAGVLTSNGLVALNGTSAAATVNIVTGTTTLGSAGRLLPTAVLTTTANLVLGGNEQVAQLFGAGNVDLTAGTLTVDSGNFSGVLQGNNLATGLTKVSAGLLTLSGANTSTGIIQINAGTVSLTGSLASSAVNVALGSVLDNVNGGLAATAALTNDGTVNMGANDTIASLVNTGTINGVPNMLTAATYALNNGSVINANLGTGVMTNNGLVALNGTSDAATVNIVSGTTTLGAAERLLNTAAVTVNAASNLLLGGNEQIGQLFGAGNVDLTAGTLTVDSGNFAGVLLSANPATGLTKVSTGVLALSGASTYTGLTQINAGTVSLTGSLASNTVNVALGSTLNNTSGGLAATAALTNDGTVNLGANNTIATLVNTGTINGAPNTLTAATYALNNGSVINANLGAGVLTSNGLVALNGTSAAATVDIVSGTTTLGSAARLLPTAVLTTTGNLVLGGNEQVAQLFGAGNVDLTAGTLTVDSGNFSGVLQGNNLATGLTKVSAGLLTLSGANTYTGITQINAGTVSLTGSLASSAVNVALGSVLDNVNGGLAAIAALTNDGTVNMGANNTIASLVNTGTINGVGTTLTAATYALNNGSVVNANLGAGVLTSNGLVALNGTSAAATVNIASGTTTLGSAGRLLTTSALTATGNLVLGGNEQVATLFGTGNIDMTAGTLTVGSGNFAGVLASANPATGLTMNGPGVLTLSGANTYTGATNVNAGALTLTGTMASNTVNVAAGSTLNNTSGGLAATAALTNNGIVNLGANNTIGTLTNTGTINGAGTTLTAATYALNNGSVINASLGAGSVTTGGVVTLTGTTAAGNISIPLGSTLNLAGVGSQLINPAVALGVNGTMNLLGGTQSVQTLSGSGLVNLNANQLNVVNGGSFTGKINGATAPLNTNGGVLTLANSATTTLSTNVGNGGTLNVTGTSNVTTQSAAVAAGSTLNIGAGSTFSASAVGGGTGGVNLANGSTLNLAPGATLNYTLLNGGTAALPGGIINAANFINQIGSTIKGFLTFTGNVTSNGTLAPGNSPGLTTILGNYTHNGILQAQIQNTTPITGYSQVRVGGTLTLNPSSTLVVQTWGGALPTSGNIYQIVANSTGGAVRVAGAFGNVQFDVNPLSLNTLVNPINNAAAVFDVNTGKMITTGLNAANSTFADLGSTPSQRGAMTALMSAAMNGVGKNQLDSQTSAGSTALALLSTKGSTASSSLARLVPEQYGGIANYSFLISRAVSDFLFVRSESLGKASGLSANGLSGGDEIDNKLVFAGYMNNKDNVSSNNVSRNDIYFGAEGGSDQFSLGALLMKNTGSISSAFGGGSVSGQGGTVYLKSALTPVLSILGSIGYSSQSYNLNRASVTGSASATTSGHGVNASLGGTYLVYDQDDFSILPRFGLGYAETSVGAFQETGSAQRLNVSGYSASRLSAQAGVLFASNTQVNGHALKLGLNLGMDSAIVDKGGVMNATMAIDPRIQFPITFAGGNKTNGTAGLSANYDFTKETSMYARYEFNSSGNGAKLELSQRF